MTIWKVAVDWDRNNNFTDLSDDISARVQSANWFVGIRTTYRTTGEDGVLDLVLRNDDKRFSPENASSPLYGKLKPFRRIRVQSDDGSTVRNHFIGWIESITPSVGMYGDRTVRIVAAGQMQFLKAAEVSLPVQTDVRAEEVISPLVRQVVPPPALAGVWSVGLAGVGEIGVNTRVGSETDYALFDEGVTIFPIVADNWIMGQSGEEVVFNAYQAINDVAAGERGRFFFNRDGKAVFWNRHRMITPVAIAATFNDTMQGVRYEYGGPDDLKNEVKVVSHPRTISDTADEVLWELNDEIKVATGKSRTFSARYEDSSGNRLAALSVTMDNVVYTGTGTITLEAKANSATITITNTGTDNLTLTGCRLKGQKITDFGRMEASALDEDSVAEFGKRTLSMSLPSVSDFDDAQNIAEFELARRKQPRGMIKTVTLKSDATQSGGHHANQLALTVGDRITVQETQTGHNSAYHIIGEEHRLDRGGALLETTWYLEPVNATFWVIGTVGYSEIGDNTTVAY